MNSIIQKTDLKLKFVDIQKYSSVLILRLLYIIHLFSMGGFFSKEFTPRMSARHKSEILF